MKKAFFSNRIYKNIQDEKHVEATEHALLTFNRAKHFATSTQVKERRSLKNLRNKSMHLTVKARFSLDDYYANSAVQEANALLSSQDELKKMYISNKEEQIKATKKKIKTTKARLTVLDKIKTSIIKGKPKFNNTSPEQQKGRFFVVEFKNRTDIYLNVYLFEHQYLDPKLKELRSRLGKFEFRLDRLEKQLLSLKTNVKNICFGSKKLMRAKNTVQKYVQQPELWKNDYYQARYGQMTISGRKDAKYGNFIFQYEPEAQLLSYKTPSSVVVQISGVVFPYGQEEVNEAIQRQLSCKDKKQYGLPVGWSVEDHGDYYIFKCIVEVPEKEQKNHSKSDGVIGIDCNFDHLAVSETNAKGQLIKSTVFQFDILGKSSGQVTKILEAEAIRIVDLAVRRNKPIVVEKLDTTKSKVSNPYGNRKANMYMSMFAYRKMLDTIKNRAEKMGVVVYEVNPAYTSQMGKMKYMKRFGISIHQAASYVIARRGMGFKEKLPPALHSCLPEKIAGLHHWAQWKYVSSLFGSIRTHAFYRMELLGPVTSPEEGIS